MWCSRIRRSRAGDRVAGRVLGGLLALMIAAPVAAQDQPPPPRPPHASGDAATVDGDLTLTDSSRPPSRPEDGPEVDAVPVPAPANPGTGDTTEQPGAGTPATPADPEPSDAAAPEPAPAEPAPVDPPVEPAGPPAWQVLAEDDFAYQSCLLGLTMLGVDYTELAPVTSPEDPDCGIARPLRIDSIQPGVAIAGGAQMRCDTARNLALWVRAEAQPAAARLPGTPKITQILPGSTYQCRARVGGSSEKLSEHALGNAFDVAGLRFSNGSELLVAPRGDSGGIEEAFQKAIRYGACLYFTTVLGPGSNAAHDDHLHFDIVARRSGWRLCE